MNWDDINWDAIGAISEALGALGVILTLVYLIRQIKQNTAATRSSAAASYSQASMSIANLLSRDVETNSLFYGYQDDLVPLSMDEKRRAQAIVSVYLHAMEEAFDLYREGTLTEEKWKSRYRQIGWVTNRPGFREYWDEFGAVYADSFAKIVDETMESGNRGSRE